MTISDELNRIETCITDHPDSALVSLEKIDTSYLSTPGLRARYALLHSMALDKNYIDVDDTDIIEPAVTYYESSSDDVSKSLAFYYQGRIFYNGNRIPESILAYRKSLAFADRDDDYRMGLIYSAMADSYNLAFDDEDELIYSKLALDSFGSYGERSYIDMARFRVARAAHNNGLYELADSLYSSIYADTDSTSVIAYFAILNQVDNDLKSEDPDAEEDVRLLEFINTSRGSFSFSETWEYVYSLLLVGDRRRAMDVLDTISGEEDDDSLDWKYRVEEELGNDAEALRLLKILLSEQNTLVREQLSQSVAKAEREQYRMSAEILARKSDLSTLKLLLAITAGLIVLLFSFLAFKRREEILSSQNDRLLQAAEESSRFIESLRAEAMDGEKRNREIIRELRKSYISLYQKQFAEISRYCDAQSMHRKRPVSDLVLDDVSKSVNELLSEVSDINEMDKFERRINTDLDGVIDKIRSDFPKFKNEDIRFICYMIAGFDSASISFLMDMSKAAVRVKKHRIRAKLAEAGGQNGELYKSLFF